MDLAYRARSCERKSALPVPRHQRSSSVGPNVQNVFCTPLTRQNSNLVKSSTRGASTRKLKNTQLPIGDKDFRAAALNKVRQYFYENSNIPINWAIFGSQPLPAATYIEMFNFLLRKMFRRVNMDPKNYVDELPRYMKALCYPVNVQKSSLLTINTNNSWPNVLAMLTFLVDLVSLCGDSAATELVNAPTHDTQVSEIYTAVWWHNLKSYIIWSNNSDGEDHKKLEEANQEFKEYLTSILHVDERVFNALAKEVKHLKAELENYKCPEIEKEVLVLEDNISSLLKDEKKVESEINKLVKDLMENQKKAEEKELKCHTLEDFNAKKKVEIQRLDEKCKTQEMNLEDKQKNQQECLELRERIRIAEELCSTLKKTSYEIDKEISKLKSQVDDPFKEFKAFQCEKGSISEMSGINIESRYNVEEWKFAKNELKNFGKHFLSKKLAWAKSREELKKKISLDREQQEQLLEEEKSRKNIIRDLERSVSKLKEEIKEIGASVIKKEEEIEIETQKVNEEKTSIDSIKAEFEERKKMHCAAASELHTIDEKVYYIENVYLQIEKDVMEKLKAAGLDLLKEFPE